MAASGVRQQGRGRWYSDTSALHLLPRSSCRVGADGRDHRRRRGGRRGVPGADGHHRSLLLCTLSEK